MGNIVSNLFSNYSERIQQGIPLIKQWINKIQTQDENQLIEIIELTRIIQEIQIKNNYSKEEYENIRYYLRPFQESLPLQIKRIFNIATLDNYTTFIASRHFESIDDFINLELSSSKWNGNMTKFFYNPISLTSTTREFFTHLQTLFIYSKEDNQFEEDKRILYREIQYVPYYMKLKHKKQLEEWTEKKCGEILFDSNVDNWSEQTTVFHDRIIGKKDLTFLIEDENNEIFGFYFNTQIIQNDRKLYSLIEYDFKTRVFHFNLQSKNNRLSKPTKFDFKGICHGEIFTLFEHPSGVQIEIGDIYLCNINSYLFMYCKQNENLFDYHEMKNVLCGGKIESNENRNFNLKNIFIDFLRKNLITPLGYIDHTKYHFIPKRILIIQMK